MSLNMDSSTSLLVVDLEQSVSTADTNLGKDSCVYTTTLHSGNSHELQISNPLQCLSELNQSISRIHQQQLSHLQPVQYHEMQVNFGGCGENESVSPLFENSLHDSSASSRCSFLSDLAAGKQDSSAETEPPPPPPMPKVKKRPLPPDLNNVPHFPINEYEYYKEIEELLVFEKYPSGVSENYKAHLRKRAQHYLIINNELHHNQKKPKKVIMRKEEQNRLLGFTHISSINGIHLGIKKMIDNIGGSYFWRGLYEDVANYVNSCPQCRDSVDVAQQREKEMRCIEEDEDGYGLTKVVTSIQTSSIVWTRVEIQVHGPFKRTTSRNEFVVTITDPESCFLQAASLPRNGCSTKLTDFILKTFYTFGFPKPFFIGDKEMFDVVSTELDWRLKQTAWKTKLIWKENSECNWVSQLTELLIMRKGERWDREMDRFMFQFRVGSIRDAFSPPDSTPFYSMFQRDPYFEDKENFDFRKRGKKKMHKNPLQCEHCDDIFTSKVSFKLHNKCHRVEEERSDAMLKAANRNEEHAAGSLESEVKGVKMELAIGELKTFFSETKEVRRKRGKYQKYSVELQERMISYAVKHGPIKASTYFSQLIGSHVSDSTIRNLIRSSAHFPPRTKEDIARFAVEFGLEKASQHFSKTLGKEVPVSLVKKFKSIYGGKFRKKNEVGNTKKKNLSFKRNINSLDEKEKDDIGSYACEHSVQETIQFFSEKISILLSEDDVQHCQKTFLNKSSNLQLVGIKHGENDIQEITYQTVPFGEDNNCFSSAAFIHISEDNYTCQSLNYQPEVEVVLQEARENKSSNDYIIMPQENIHPYETNALENSSSDSSSCLNEELQECVELKGQIPEAESHKQEQKLLGSAESLKTAKEKTKAKNKDTVKKRGSYMTYSPEMRAKIGKYAAENGSLKASNYFSKVLGHYLPVSTARGLKEKYLDKMRHCDVTSLGYNPRGRPLRLGKYDEIVQECLKELIRSGERLTSFLAITTAKQILTKFEPSLLQENGGPVILNSTWAKSFLKRIGVRNNS